MELQLISTWKSLFTILVKEFALLLGLEAFCLFVFLLLSSC